MKSLATGTISGCLIWVILFVILAPILWIGVFVTSSMLTFTDFSYRLMQPILCPAGTRLDVKTFDTTTTDSNHQTIGAVGHDMNCVNSDGETIEQDLVVEYLLYWRGIGLVSGIILAIPLTFLFAAPGGTVIVRVLKRFSKQKNHVD